MYKWDRFPSLQLPGVFSESAAATSVPGGSWREDIVFLPPIALPSCGKSKNHVCNDKSTKHIGSGVVFCLGRKIV